MNYNDEDEERLYEVNEPAPAYDKFMTPEKYLQWEDEQPWRHEYMDGLAIQLKEIYENVKFKSSPLKCID